MDPHMALCVAEHFKPEPRRCTECNGEAEGNHSWSDGSGEICNACIEHADEEG